MARHFALPEPRVELAQCMALAEPLQLDAYRRQLAGLIDLVAMTKRFRTAIALSQSVDADGHEEWLATQFVQCRAEMGGRAECDYPLPPWLAQ